MPSIIDTAPPSATLELKDSNTAYFMMRDQQLPTTVTLPGSSNFDLTLFNVTATGSVKPAGPGTLILTLYGAAKPTGEDIQWLPLAASVEEPIGGAGELEETMWMIEGSDLMIFLGSGKMQGTFKTNVANNPQAPIDLEQHPGDIENTDPLYVFAIGASFTPTGAARGAVKGAARAALAEGVLCSLEMANLTINA
jgi:hypothetical protein